MLFFAITASAGVMDGTLYWSDANAVYQELRRMGVECNSNIVDTPEYGRCYVIGFENRYFGYPDLYHAKIEDEDTQRVIIAVGAIGRVSRDVTWSSDFLVMVFEDCLVVVETSTCRYVEALASQGDRFEEWVEYLVDNSIVIY